MIRFLVVEAGADLRARDEEGNTALLMASLVYRNVAPTRLLYELGSDLTDTTIAGATVFHLAAKLNRRKTLRFLHGLGY